MSSKVYKTKVVINLQDTQLTYFAPESTELVIPRLTGGHPVFLQTFDGHCVIVNPNQIPAIEVYAMTAFTAQELGVDA